MAEGGRHLCRSAGPTSNAQAGSDTAGGPGPSRLLIVPKDGDPTTSLCNLCSAPSFTVKKVFTDVQAKPCVSVCTHCFLSHHCIPLKSLTSVFFALSCYFHTLLFSGLDSQSQLSLERYSSPSIISVALCWSLSSSPTSPLH